MRLLLLGNTGQLGWELQRTLPPLGIVVACDYPDMNMADAVSIRKVVQSYRPDVIVNATAYTAVDKAESMNRNLLKRLMAPVREFWQKKRVN